MSTIQLKLQVNIQLTLLINSGKLPIFHENTNKGRKIKAYNPSTKRSGGTQRARERRRRVEASARERSWVPCS